MEKKLLEVGDVVYAKSYTYQTLRKVTVTKTTPKQAFVDGKKVRREVEEGGYMLRLIGDKWGSTTYYLPTPSIEKKYQTQELKKEVKNLILIAHSNLKTFNLSQLQTLKNALTKTPPPPTPEKEEIGWIKVDDLDVDNLPGGDFIGFGSGEPMAIGGLFKITQIDSNNNKTHYVVLEFNDGDDAIQPTHVIPLSSLLKLPNLNTPPKPNQPTPPLVEWIPIEDIDMEEGVKNDEGMENWRVEYLGVDKEGSMLRGYYFENKGKKYIEDDDGWIQPTHLIPIKNLLNLPKK